MQDLTLEIPRRAAAGPLLALAVVSVAVAFLLALAVAFGPGTLIIALLTILTATPVWGLGFARRRAVASREVGP